MNGISAVNGSANNRAASGHNRLELSFEYLMHKDELRWITVMSEQAILISICLQSMVDELLSRRKGLKVPGDYCTRQIDVRRGSWSYMKRDGSSHQLNKMVRSVSTDSGFVDNGLNGSVKGFKVSCCALVIRLNSVIYDVVVLLFACQYNAKKGSIIKTSRPLVENNAFDGIGDDDL